MMKKIRRLAALLLAGMMALMVFTGCGSAVSARDVEETHLAYLNSMRVEAGEEELSNDPEIRRQAYEMLSHIDPENGLIDYDEANKYIDEYRSGKSVQTTIHVLFRNRLSSNKVVAYEVTPENLADMKAQLAEQGRLRNPVVSADAIGVAARTINGRTYVAYGYRGSGLPD